jgi:DNA-binding MarR family transcriptional regulator
MKKVKGTATTLSLFLEVGRLIRSRMEGTMPLPFAQCEVLYLVDKKEKPSMHELAKYFKITAPSATSLVDELVKGGYMERKTDPKDRRQVRLKLNSKGKAAVTKVIAQRKKVLSEVLAVLSSGDKSDLNRILQKMLEHA